MKRLFPCKFIIYQNCLLDKKISRQIIASCKQITDSNLTINTDVELNKIQSHDSKLIKDYLINYAKDEGVFGGIYYEKNPADGKVHLFVVEFFIFKDVPTINDKITEYNDYVAAVATSIDENGKIENYHYTSVFSSENVRSDIQTYKQHVQIEGLWLEYLEATDYTSVYKEAEQKIDQNERV